MTTSSSKLFFPYRAIGVVTDGSPFVLNRLGEECFITSSVGKAFQIYRCEHLRVCMVSPAMPKRINCLAVRGDEFTYVGVGSEVLCWKRLSCQGALGSHPGVVRFLLCLGTTLVSICDEGRMRAWQVKSKVFGAEALQCDMAFPPEFVPSAAAHPPTYLNKVVVGSTDGRLLLCNIRSGKTVHAFSCLGKGGSDGGGEKASGVTAIEPSPALDVAAVGLASGRILMVNLKKDEVLFSFLQKGAVTALAFRTDMGSAQLPMVVSGSPSGHVHIWNLKDKRLHHTMRAHGGKVSQLEFLPREPVLVSGGHDNSIRMWLFDSPDGTARLLRSREGHSKPPRKIRYYGGDVMASTGEGASALCLLSGGGDGAFRLFHTVRDCLSVEFSQKPLVKVANLHQVAQEDFKLHPIVCFATCETRSQDWANVITCHEEDCNAYLWKYKDRVITKAVLRQKHWAGNSMMNPPDVRNFATSVTISSCGNFGLVGTRGGQVWKYNMQSGEPRGSYPSSDTPIPPQLYTGGVLKPGSVAKIMAWAKGEGEGKGKGTTEGLETASAKAEREGHTAAVRGVQVDAMNSTVVSGGLDGRLLFWSFLGHELTGGIQIDVGISHIELVRDTDLLAVVCDDQVIRLFDLTTRKLVRRLSGHTGMISDICFTPDGRRLVSSALDSTIRVWDLPTGRCVDWMRFKKAVTGLSMSPTGEFLATCHVDRLGVQVWSDRSFFQPVYLDSEPTEPYLMDEAAPLAEEEEALAGGESEEAGTREGEVYHQDGRAIRGARASSTTMGEQQELAEEEVEGDRRGVITLSALPRAYWVGLFNLEVVKARNKPTELPVKPKNAPFFLRTVHDKGQVEPRFAAAQELEEEEAVRDLASRGNGGDAWSDTEGNEDGDEQAGKEVQSSGKEAPAEKLGRKGRKRKLGEGMPSSRIMQSMSGSGTTGGAAEPSRCKLADLLIAMAGLHQRTHDKDAPEKGDDVMGYLSTLGPSAVDVELQSLCHGPQDVQGVHLLGLAADFFLARLRSRTDFEVVQAYLHRFLKLHGEVMMGEYELRTKANELREVQAASTQHLKKLVQQSLCLVQFFGGQQA